MTTTAVVFNGVSLIDSASLGGRWRVLGLDGWYTRTLRHDRLVKAGQAGAWPSTGQDADLPIVIRGDAIFATADVAKAAARSLIAAASVGSVELSVTDGLGTTTRQVEADGVNATPTTNSARFEWSLVLNATDPLLYGGPTFAQAALAASSGGTGLVYPLAYPIDYGVAPGVTPGAVSVANAGTASYWPRLRIDGPVPNPTVTLVETGAWVHYAGTVTSGQWLDIDCANRRVLLNGQVSVRQSVTSSGDWLRVPPGGGSVSWTADGADPAALLSVWAYEGAWL